MKIYWEETIEYAKTQWVVREMVDSMGVNFDGVNLDLAGDCACGLCQL